MASPAERARSFGAVADLYDRVRPGYPEDAVKAVLPASAETVLDVGAGTGKLTEALVRLGLHAIAVEPDDGMRARLAGKALPAEVRAGTAEELPVGDGEVDAVVFGQSWHWVDSTKAAAEASRVLRPSGTLGLLWNRNDDRIEWVARVLRIAGHDVRVTDFEAPESIPGFCEGHRFDVAWEHPLRRTELIELVQTWSVVSTLPELDRLAVVERVEKWLAESPATANRETLTWPEVCATFTYHLVE